MVKEIHIKEEKINVREKFEKGWLDVVAIIEIAGKPASHLKEVMEKLLDNLSKEKDIKLIYRKVNEPKEIENQETKEIFSTFAEIEILAVDFARVMEFVFDYTPSSIEIVAPKDMALNLNDANNLLNDLAAKIHKYESYVKDLAAQNVMFKNAFEKIAKARESKESEVKEENEKAEKQQEVKAEEKEEKEEKRKKKSKKE